jgi:hypothetical protein
MKENVHILIFDFLIYKSQVKYYPHLTYAFY